VIPALGLIIFGVSSLVGIDEFMNWLRERQA
jgi:hypothetical protein